MSMSGKKHFIINIIYWALILALVYVAFKYVIRLAMPFVLAVIISAALRPAAVFIARRTGMSVKVSAVLSAMVFFAALGTLIVLLSAKAVTQVASVMSELPRIYTESIEPGLTALALNLQSFAARFDGAVVSLLESVVPQMLSTLGGAVTNFSVSVVTAVSGFAAKLPSKLLSAVICVIATIFILVDYKRISDFALLQLPERPKRLAVAIKRNFFDVVKRYGKSYALILLITFAEIAVGLLLMGQKNAMLIAAVIAVFDIFPIVGAGLILLPWAVIRVIQGNVAGGACLGLLYLVVTIIRQIIEPKIVGRHVGLHPLVTLMSMFIGVSLFGGIGLLGLPLTIAVIKNLDDSGTINIFKKASNQNQ